VSHQKGKLNLGREGVGNASTEKGDGKRTASTCKCLGRTTKAPKKVRQGKGGAGSVNERQKKIGGKWKTDNHQGFCGGANVCTPLAHKRHDREVRKECLPNTRGGKKETGIPEEHRNRARCGERAKKKKDEHPKYLKWPGVNAATAFPWHDKERTRG